MRHENTEGMITVYQENNLRTSHFTVFETIIDTANVNKDTHVFLKTESGTMSIKIDVYRPTERHIENLEREVKMLEAYIDTLRTDETED